MVEIKENKKRETEKKEQKQDKNSLKRGAKIDRITEGDTRRRKGRNQKIIHQCAEKRKK
jgi:hypothetical protein